MRPFLKKLVFSLVPLVVLLVLLELGFRDWLHHEAETETVLRFGPRLVILGFTVFNDAETRAVHDAATKDRVKRESKSHFRLARFVKDHSYFVNWLAETLRREKRREGMDTRVEVELRLRPADDG